MKSNDLILHQIIEWGQGLDGFRRSHASYGLHLAQGYLEGLQGDSHFQKSEEAQSKCLLLLGMDIAWVFWLDDRFDALPSGSMLADSGRLIDWETIVEPNEHQALDTMCAETRGFLHLRSQLQVCVTDTSAFQLWQKTAADLYHSFCQERLASQSDKRWSYTEYMQNAEISLGAMHVIATISLLYDLQLQARMTDSHLTRALRNLFGAMRLQNDVNSIDKERAEGVLANAVILAEEFMPTAQAQAFVASQTRGYERLFAEDIRQLGPNDVLAKVMSAMLVITESMYENYNARYRGAK